MKYIQRHGESESNVTRTFTCRLLDPGLSELGRKQIRDLIPQYKTERINHIFSSPSKRAAESAEILAEGLGVAFRTDDCLLEVDVGLLEGKSEHSHELLDQFYSVIKDWIIENKNTQFPGGESFEDVHNRLKAVGALLSLENTVVVGHSTLFAVFLGKAGVPFSKVQDLFLPRGGMAKYSHEAGTWSF